MRRICFAVLTCIVLANLVTSGQTLPDPAKRTAEELERKKEGIYLTGLPLVSSDPTTGLGYGLRVYLFDNGKRADPRFASTPYLHRLYAQVFRSTGGLSYHAVNWDAPRVGGSDYRIRARAAYERDAAANFFGLGTDPLRFAGRAFPDMASYDQALSVVDATGRTNALFNKYEVALPHVAGTVQRYFSGGVLRVQAGMTVMHVDVRDRSGENVDVSGTEVANGTTRLRQDLGDAREFRGGWNNTVRLGIAYDTRDYEPDPRRGIFADLVADFSGRGTGSDFTYAHGMGAVRAYYRPFPRRADLVLAGRAHYSAYSPGAPFFTLNAIGVLDDGTFFNGLGGLRTLRGYQQDRFVDYVASVANAEARWTAKRVTVFGQDLGVMLVPFADFGRTFRTISETTLRGWRHSQGIGLRLAWNQATVIVMDYARSPEGSGVYINFNHIF